MKFFFIALMIPFFANLKAENYNSCSANAGADQIVCGNTTTLHAVEQIGDVNTHWLPVMGVVFNDINSPTPILTASSYGTYTLTWEITNDIGLTCTDEVVVTFKLKPTVLAGPVSGINNTYFPGLFGPNSEIKTDTVCGLNYPLNAYINSGGYPVTGTWYSTDPTNSWFSSEVDSAGILIPSHLANDTFNFPFYTVFYTPNYRDIIWVADNDGCIDKDTLRLYFAPRPTGDFTATMPGCRHQCSRIVANTSGTNNVNLGISRFDWNYISSNGTLCSQTHTPVNQQDTIWVYWNSGLTHNVELQTYNSWGCYSPSRQLTVTEPALFNPSYDINPATCGQPNGEIILSTDNNSFQYTWLNDSILPNLPDDTIQYNMIPGQSYSLVVAGLSLSPDAPAGYMCHDTISVTMINSGAINAFFDTLITQNLPVPQNLHFQNYTAYSNIDSTSWNIYNSSNDLIHTSNTTHLDFVFTESGCYTIELAVESKVDTSWFGLTRYGCRDTMNYHICFGNSSINTINIPQESILVSPNPMNNSSVVHIPFNSSQSAISTGSIIISDISGTVVLNETLQFNQNVSSETTQIPLYRGSLVQGIYFIEIVADQVYRGTLVVE